MAVSLDIQGMPELGKNPVIVLKEAVFLVKSPP
jgi:hypothetical protein